MRIPRITAAAVVAASAATLLTGTPAHAAPAPGPMLPGPMLPGPMLLVPAVKAVHSARPTWVKAYWGTTRDICDAKVTVRVTDTDVMYPSNTATYTSFSHDDTLADGANDYTAVRLTTTVDHTIVRAMHLTIRYRAASAEGCAGPVMTRTFYASLPVRKG
jgi:hypothetical protein